MKDKHRIVKIDFSVLEEFLTVIVSNEAVAEWDECSCEWRVSPLSKELKQKAENILKNS